MRYCFLFLLILIYDVLFEFLTQDFHKIFKIVIKIKNILIHHSSSSICNIDEAIKSFENHKNLLLINIFPLKKKQEKT